MASVQLHLKVPESRRCRVCRRILDASAFPFRDAKREKRRTECKQCNRTHREPARKAYRLKSRYGLTMDQYWQMFKAQDGRCAICSKTEISQSRYGAQFKLSVDHDHKTGKVRGLLCHKCNKGIGVFEDNADLLLSALRYLAGAEKDDASLSTFS